jgi:hypothetical protein
VTGDLDATITDANSVVHDVSVIGLFRAYPDHTSWYARDSLDRSSANLFGGLEPYDGMYWATLQLTALGGAPLPLAPGPATIAITSTELVDTGLEFGFGYSEGTLASFPIEILEGTRVPTYEETQQYTAYRSQRGLTIEPSTLAGISEVGGLQVSLTYQTSRIGQGGGGATVAPRIVPLSHDPNINLLQSTVDNGDGTSTVTAFMTNPNGFVANADLGGDWTVGKSTFADLGLAVVATDAGTATNADPFTDWDSDCAGPCYWIETAESFYVDSNGDVLVTVSPVLGLSF